MIRPSSPWLLGCLLGCTGAQQAGRGGAPAEDGVQVSLQIEALHAGEGRVRLLAPGEALRSGDRIAMTVAVDRPAYVYVAQVPQGGGPQVLFPASGQRQITPGALVRLPGPQSWFPLDDRVGSEDVFVVGSARPLSDQGICNTLRLPCAGAQALQDEKKPPPPPPKDKEPPPPDLADLDKRALTRAQDRTLRGRTDASGVVVLRFRFQHGR